MTEQIELLNQATTQLSEDERWIKDLFINLATRSGWFKEKSTFLLKNGFKIISEENVLLDDHYKHITNKTIIIPRNLIDLSIPKSILFERFTLFLRHEVAYARDVFVSKNRDITQFEYDRIFLHSRMTDYEYYGNVIFDQLKCIYDTKTVNTEVLDTVSKLVATTRVVDNYLDDDLSALQKLFKLTSHIRPRNNQTELDPFFKSTFEPDRIVIWSNLTPKQRMALSTLFTIRSNLFSQVASSPCFPQLEDCMAASELRCFRDTILSCRYPGVDSNYFQVGASLFEALDPRSDPQLESIAFSNLCEDKHLYYFRTANERTAALITMKRSLGYSFINALTDEFVISALAEYKVKNPMVYRVILGTLVALIPSLINFYYHDSYGLHPSFYWNIIVPMTLTIAKTIIEPPAPNSRGAFFVNTARHCYNVFSVASVVTVSNNKWEAIGSISTGILGSIGGSMLGKSLSKWWRPNATQPLMLEDSAAIRLKNH